MTGIILIVVLAVLVLVHELGHFVVAKKIGIKVEEFGLGLPPRAFGKKIGDTLYSLNWIPFGGFVRMPDEDTKPSAAVIVAGVLANVYLAFIILTAVFMLGLPVSLGTGPERGVSESWVALVGVRENSPAAGKDLPIPAKIISLQSEDGEVTVRRPEDVSTFVREAESVTLLIEDGSGKRNSYTILPRDDLLGVEIGLMGIKKLGLSASLKESYALTGELLIGTTHGIFSFLRDVVLGRGSFDSVSGPVGIAGILRDASRESFAALLFITALISLSLAVINLLPFPALDGGRLAIMLIERLRGRPLPEKFVKTLNLAGFATLILLMLFITYHDIAKLT